MLWRGQMSFRLLLHAVLLYTILMHIIKIRSDLFRITVYYEKDFILSLGIYDAFFTLYARPCFGYQC